MLLMLYYGMISLFFIFGSSIMYDYNVNASFNDTSLSDDEIDTGGLFGTGVSFGRFALFVTLGIGLPDDTPSWFSSIFIIWQSMVTILAVGFVISSIWNG